MIVYKLFKEEIFVNQDFEKNFGIEKLGIRYESLDDVAGGKFSGCKDTGNAFLKMDKEVDKFVKQASKTKKVLSKIKTICDNLEETLKGRGASGAEFEQFCNSKKTIDTIYKTLDETLDEVTKA